MRITRFLKRAIFAGITIAGIFAFESVAADHNTIFSTAFDAIKDKEATFKPGAEWFPYPEYKDRAAWNELCAPFKDGILKEADLYLERRWEVFKASTYLEYEKTGDRKLADGLEKNISAIVALTLGELCDGTGKYLHHLTDGLMLMSQQHAWSHFQHTQYQDSKRTLPSPEEYVVSLRSAVIAADIAVAYHFFKEEFDRIDPLITKTIEEAVDRQVLTPFFSEKQDAGSHSIWTGFKKAPGKKMNNWSPYCDHHVLTAFLLMEKDPQHLLKAIDRTIRIMDIYMGDQRSDGGCDEGPGYWNMAFAKVYDYARMIYDASAGKLDVFGTEMIRRMGEYKSRTYFNGGWTLSFGDCTPRDAGSPAIMFRYGKDLGSEELMKFSIYLLRDNKNNCFKTPSLNYGAIDGTYRQLESMRYQKSMTDFENRMVAEAGGFKKAVRTLISNIKSEYYPETGYATIRRGKWELGCKGGHNGESHNHNDVGSAVLFFDTMPVLYDSGAGTYTKDTFGANRYKVWTMQSQWHNCPSPNGVNQANGAVFSSRNTACDLDNGSFLTDIAGAYPEKAACKEWKREYMLTDHSCTITDNFILSERKASDSENFLIRGEAALPGESIDGITASAGEVLLKIRTFEGGRGGIVRLLFPETLTAHKEVKDIKDKRLRRCSGPSLTRLRFVSSPDAPLAGEYSFSFEELAQ